MPGSGFCLTPVSPASPGSLPITWSLALRTQNVAEVLERFCFCQNKTHRSPRASPGAEQGLRQRMMLCEKEKPLEGSTGISLEVLIWLLMTQAGHSSIPTVTKLEVLSYRHSAIASSHYHSSHLYSTFPVNF